MTLFVIATVAPVPLNGGSGSCDVGIQMPPPKVTAVSGWLLLTPPVTVTPSIDTDSLSGAVARKIVSTGPPPVIVVAPEPAPLIATLLSMVTPPAKVPAATVIVSPSCAAVTAACKVEEHPADGPTHRVFAAAGDALAASSSPAATRRRFMPASFLSLLVVPRRL